MVNRVKHLMSQQYWYVLGDAPSQKATSLSMDSGKGDVWIGGVGVQGWTGGPRMPWHG